MLLVAQVESSWLIEPMSTRGFDGHQSEFDYIVLYYTLTVQLIDGLYNTVTKR